MPLSVKVSKGSEIRRVELDESQHSFDGLYTTLVRLFNLENSAEVVDVLYFDDSDWITLSSDAETREMFNAFSCTTSPLRIKLMKKRGWDLTPVHQIAETVLPVVQQIAGGVGTVYDKVKPQVETARREGMNLAQKAKPFAQNVISTAEPVVQQISDKVSPFAQQVAAKITPIANKVEEKLNSNANFVQVSDFITTIQDEIWQLNREMQKAFVGKQTSNSSQQTNNTETNEASTATSEEKNLMEMEELPEIESETPEELKNHIHHALCDNCRVRIVGWRHKCNECEDYDLCHNCFIKSRSCHPTHKFSQIGKEEKRQPESVSIAPVSAPVVAEENLMTKEKLEESVKTLEDMGFTDKQKTIRAIINNKNDLVKAVMELLDN